MPTYIAMLRGINVSGQKLIKMEALRASFEAMGFTQIQSYVQSGNVVFVAGKVSADDLSRKIKARIQKDFGFEVPVFLRTADELREISTRNPFLADPAVDPSKLHVTFLSDAAPKNASEVLHPLATKPERFHVAGRELYLYCPDGYGRTKLSNTGIERKLSLGATTRNWKTVCALVTMCC